MNPFPTTTLESVLQPAAWALVHFLWQGALVALAVAGVLRLLRRRSAEMRYLTALAGLVVMSLLPLATAFYLGSSSGQTAVLSMEGSTADTSASRPERPAESLAAPLRERGFEASWLRHRLEPYLPGLVAVWLLGVALLSLAHLGGWNRVRRLRRDTRPAPERWKAALARLSNQLGVARSVELLESARARVPVVLGWIRPAILVPASSFTGLSPQQLEAVLAHELAHIRRHDYVVNLFQLVVETLLFYHPGVWWLSRRVRVERENCCDDLAVGLCENPVVYARALADLEELRFGSPALALGADGGSLLGRIRRLLDREEEPADGWLAAGVAALVAMLVAAIGIALVFFASSSNAMPAPENPDPDGTVAARETPAPEEGAEEPSPEPDDSWVYAEPEPDTWVYAEPEPDTWVHAEPQPDDRWLRAEPEGEFVLAWAGPQEEEDDDRKGRRRLRWWREDDKEGIEHEVEDLRRAVQGTPYERLSEDDLRDLARHAFDPDLVPVLVDAGVTGASAGDLEDLARHGLDAEDVREYYDAGFEDLSIDDLVDLARNGVDGEDVREFNEAGLTGLTGLDVADMLSLARNGVDGEDVREFTRSGYEGATVEDMVRLSRNGIDGEDVREFNEAGFANLSVDDLVELSRNGVGGDDVREFKEAGYTDLSVDDMVRLSRNGIDGEDVRDFVEAGFTDLPVADLLTLARNGIDGEDARDFRESGYPDISVDDMVSLARSGVDGGDVREFRSAGLDPSVDDMIRLARSGIDGDDVGDYQSAGYGKLSVEQMIDLARSGVDGEDLKDLREAGHDLSVEEVLRLARRGQLHEMMDDE